jgi:catechol 2,3-dioxygenase
MAEFVISAMGHVAIRVTDLDAAVWTATQIMGLRESERVDDTVYLTHGSPHHSLQYLGGATDGVDHIGLVASDASALEEIRRRVDRAGHEVISDTPLDVGIEEGFAFSGPDGFVYEIYIGMEDGQPTYPPTGVRPTRFGHVNLYSSDIEATRSFFEEILDFRLCDTVGDREGFFLRCNVDHHGVAVLRGEGVMHHHAWEVESIADLGRLGDYLDDCGRHLLWGPVRHGIGRNIAAYFREPAGTVVEFYTDMERIYDEHSFVPRVWQTDDQRWYSFWAPMRNPEFRTYGLPAVVRQHSG